MNETMQRTVHAVAAIAAVAMLVASLSALAVVRADNREPELVAAGPGNLPGQQSTNDGVDGVDGVNGSTNTTAAGGSSSNGDAGPTEGDGLAGGTGDTTPGGNTGNGGGTTCADYNPNEGVFCDRWRVGGTTILSGPLAIYGEAGLRGGQSWIQYFREELAPSQRVRPAELVYYDDNLDPNKTLQFTQRLVEVDKVLLIGGVTSPGAIAAYLEKVGVPFIGDLGLNPESYESTAIFPTNAPFEVSFGLRARTAARNGAKTITVIQDVLPGVNPDIYRADWQRAAKAAGVTMLSYTSIASDANSCDSKMLDALRQQPEWVMLPVAAGAMLGCMREAATQQAGIGKIGSPQLVGWSGGSNLQFEVDQCGAQCDGMYSAGTPFLDPRTNTSKEAKAYIRNMARYAPGIDVTGFIPINYYHAGLLQFEVMKQGGILNNLSRKSVMAAADGFGPFETGFGNTVHWAAGKVPRVPTTCGYEVLFKWSQRRWVFQSKKHCL